jgi:hypothetical protein
MQPNKYHEDDAMAKATIGRVARAKVKAPPPASADKKAKGTGTPKKQVAAKKAKAAAPKMAAAPKKAAAPKAPPPKKTTAKRQPVAAKRSQPSKKASARPAPPPKQPVAPKAAARAKSAAKTVAVKKAAPRRLTARIAVPTPAARRGRPAAVSRKAPPSKLSSGAPQVFTVSHLDEADFKADGLRTYAHYRDLGIAAATGGLCQAHVIRLVPPCTHEVRRRHLHKTELQLVYVLKGWMKNEFAGHGEQMMSVGSCWLQPSGIEHTVLDYSADCEVLEIIVPADFKTEDAA